MGKNKILVICGPTATGKTALGLKLAKKFGGEVVSADSRQVYKGMDIATGKDIDGGKKKSGIWYIKNIPVWLLDVADPGQLLSVAQYHRLAHLAIEDIWKRKRLPILVGGTGLYIKAMINGIDTLGIPPNPQLRATYAKKIAEDLFGVLLHLDPETANSLNRSERKNKQRLLRRIEIAQAGVGKKHTVEWKDLGVLMLGLSVPNQILREKIFTRIDRWIARGAQGEVARLVISGVGWDTQAMSAIGYRQWRPFFEGSQTRSQVIQRWKQEEWRYSRRQLTWFKKDKRIRWFDTTEPGWQRKVEKLVGSWYDTSRS